MLTLEKFHPLGCHCPSSIFFQQTHSQFLIKALSEETSRAGAGPTIVSKAQGLSAPGVLCRRSWRHRHEQWEVIPALMPPGEGWLRWTDRTGEAPLECSGQAGLSDKRALKQRREGRRTFQTEGTARTKALGGGRTPRTAARLSES